MKSVIINATAAKTSGALTILKDFINFCSSNNSIKDNEIHFILFTVVNDFIANKNLEVIKLPEMSWKDRIMWDSGKLRDFCIKKNIKPDLIISMQNTCTKYPGIPQLVYYHQSIPLISYHWNIFDKDEFKLFLYAHFYKYFVNKNNDEAVYVVQLPYIKEKFMKKFKKIDAERIYVIRPNNPDISCSELKRIDQKYRFLYPATPMSYKNHKCIIKAFNIINKQCPDILQDVEVCFTVPDRDNKIIKNINKYKLNNIIKCINKISYDKLMHIYASSNVLLFPSYIETYGIPLIEGARFGLIEVVADLPYAREVLENYKNVIYINPKDYKMWANEIIKLIKNRKDYQKVDFDDSCINTWNNFYEVICKIINI